MVGKPVVLEPYDPRWPACFDVEAARLQDAFAPAAVAIEHIGSTSVPGMAAKPVIDILLGADSLAAIERRIGVLEAVGYRYVPKHELVLPLRRYFVSPASGTALVHVHGVVTDSRIWREHLAFREALRTDPRLFGEYLALKRDLAMRYAGDRAAYTDAKAPFIRRVLGERLPD